MAGNVEKRQYIKGFDGLRALLALGVVLLHAMQRIQADRTWSQPILDAVANVSWVSVDAFFARYEGKAPGQKKREVGAAVPFGRMGTAEDLTGMAIFLATGEADYIVAQTYNVDGGNWMN